tara:strand:- start:93 stop:407 length:315 start_codon:yes stop_codon:yes gene_type:complete
MIVEILLGISILINTFLVWYIIKLVRRFLNVSDELEEFFVLLEEYAEHVDSVYQLERFYGDATLEGLMKHSKATADSAKNFRIIYDINYEPEEDAYYEEYEGEE